MEDEEEIRRETGDVLHQDEEEEAKEEEVEVELRRFVAPVAQSGAERNQRPFVRRMSDTQIRPGSWPTADSGLLSGRFS